MTFILRTWAYFCHSAKSVSLTSLALIVSTQLVVLCSLTMFANAPVVASLLTLPHGTLTAEARNDNSISNITLLDLYPELKDYLWKKALTQYSSTTGKSAISQTDVPHYSNLYTDYSSSAQQQPTQYNTLQNGWGGWGTDYTSGYYGNGNGQGVIGVPSMSVPSPAINSGAGGIGHGNSREDSDPESSYNYQKEVLKHWHPFGSPEFYDSWKFKPSPPKSHPPSVGWSSVFPFWEEEEESHHVSHELSKDFSCLAGLLGLKTLKTLKFAAVFKKLKIIAVFFIAFKLGVLLSPIAIPLLFPIIILVTVVKVLPLILIIVLLLKILKKQVKIKKPFGKFLDGTGSLFFDDVDIVSQTVHSSDDEYIDKLSSGIQKKSSGRSKSAKDANKRNNKMLAK